MDRGTYIIAIRRGGPGVTSGGYAPCPKGRVMYTGKFLTKKTNLLIDK